MPQQSTAPTWARPNDRKWCNVCKIFIDGKPSKVREHEAAGRHTRNMRLQMKAMRQREVNERVNGGRSEMDAIERAAMQQLVKDRAEGFITDGTLYRSAEAMSRAPSRAPPRSDSSRVVQPRPVPASHAQGDDSAPVYYAPAEPSTVVVDEATGIGQWESVPVSESSAAHEQAADDDKEPAQQEPAQSQQQRRGRHHAVDVDDFTINDSLEQMANDYGLTELQRQRPGGQSDVKGNDPTPSEPWRPGPDSGAGRVVFKKRRKA
ncbi:U1-type domain-containing protein [Plasmodiophora brassicae]